MTLSRTDRAAITFDHLLTFIAQVDISDARMDVLRLRDLLVSTISTAAAQGDPCHKLLLVALKYVHEAQQEVSADVE